MPESFKHLRAGSPTGANPGLVHRHPPPGQALGGAGAESRLAQEGEFQPALQDLAGLVEFQTRQTREGLRVIGMAEVADEE